MSPHSEAPSGLTVIFGSGGGIGGALLAAVRGPVIGFSRRTAIPVDLRDEATIRNAARHVEEQGVPHLVIVATGRLDRPEKTVRSLDPDAMAEAFAINTIGPALILKHMVPLLSRHHRSVIAVLSAKVGSIGDNRLGGWHSYRASKAALNQIVRTTAVELRRTHPGAICVAVHPGTVDTPLSQGFSKTGLQVQRPEDAARDILAGLSGLTPDRSGTFMDRFGTPLPW